MLVAEALSEAVADLHRGKKSAIPSLLEKMKELSEGMEPELQRDISEFIMQITFQMDYDPEHLVTHEIKKAADRLLSDLGFPLPKEES